MNVDNSTFPRVSGSTEKVHLYCTLIWRHDSVPQGVHILVTGTCDCVTLRGRRDFVDMIKGKTLNAGGYPWLSGWAHSNCVNLSKWRTFPAVVRKKSEEGSRSREMLFLKMKEWVHEPRNVDLLHSLEEARRWIPPQELWKEIHPENTFSFQQTHVGIVIYRSVG